MLSETQRQFFSKSVNFNFSSLLDDTVEWIGKNTNPEDVFSADKLEQWAITHFSRKIESLEKTIIDLKRQISLRRNNLFDKSGYELISSRYPEEGI